MPEDHSDWLLEIRKQLDSQAEMLDAATCSKLTQGRFAAVDAARRPGRERWFRWLAPMATAGLLGVAVMLAVHFHSQALAPVSVPQELTAVNDLQDLELVEDLEFYVWLEKEMDDSQG